ncbi:TolC family outer membrane protein [Polycladidibacter stylochi]|uniref:TolC family outer membrane protein n=1 Tax=Polycladidibacter stylochi TaxID=1807766 RepID=UPI0008344167|nr:TolC family outer membrane protein [Pseudovibrio stylochi]
MILKCLAVISTITLLGSVSATAMTLKEAVDYAVNTNPSILEAAANRRARGQDLRASQAAYMPTLDVSGHIGAERRERDNNTKDDSKWRNGKQIEVRVEQLLFDGLKSTNEIYREGARVDGAALRVLERSEAIALDAIEAYIDVIRHQRVLRLSKQNTAKHRELYKDVRAKYDGGNVGAADLAQAEERVAATKIVTATVRKSLLDTMAKFRRVIGKEPTHLKPVGAVKSPAQNLSAAIAMAGHDNPFVLAADADVDAAGFKAESSKGVFMPRFSLEGRAAYGHDVDGRDGRQDDYRLMLRMRWNLYSGGRDSALYARSYEQLAQAQAHADTARRETTEAVERSWAALQTTRERISALRETVAANEKVVAGYRDEYNVGQRTLLDLLNAENALFKSRIDLISARSVLTFSSYQLHGTTGNLLAMMDIEAPAESLANTRDTVSILPQKPAFELEPLRQ